MPKSPFAARLAFALPVLFALAALPHAGLSQTARAADPRVIVGDWEGTLDPGAQPKKRIVVHISAAQDGTLTGSLDYPDQDTSGIAMTAITFNNPALHFESTSNLSVYDGTLTADRPPAISGTLKQGGSALSLILKRTP